MVGGLKEYEGEVMCRYCIEFEGTEYGTEDALNIHDEMQKLNKQFKALEKELLLFNKNVKSHQAKKESSLLHKLMVRERKLWNKRIFQDFLLKGKS